MMYYGVIYFKDGRKEETSRTDNRAYAERMAAERFEMRTKFAVSDWFKPTRFEVKEEK